MLPLGLLETGEKAEVLEIRGCGNDGRSAVPCSKAQGRIEDMGLRSGKEVEVLSNESHGPMLVRIDESRIALGRGMAMKIMVKKK